MTPVELLFLYKLFYDSAIVATSIIFINVHVQLYQTYGLLAY